MYAPISFTRLNDSVENRTHRAIVRRHAIGMRFTLHRLAIMVMSLGCVMATAYSQAKPQILWQDQIPNTFITRTSVSPNGSYVGAAAVSYPGAIGFASIYDASNGTQVWSYYNGATTEPQFSPDGAHFAIGNGALRLFQLDGFKELIDIPSPSVSFQGSSVTAVAYSPNGSMIAAGSYDGALQVYSTTNGSPVAGFVSAPFQGGGSIDSLLFSRDGNSVFCSTQNSYGGEVFQIKRGASTVTGLYGYDSPTVNQYIKSPTLVLSLDGSLLYVASNGGPVVIINVSTAQQVGQLTGPILRLAGFGISADGGELIGGGAAQNETSPNIRIWSLADGYQQALYDLSPSPAVNYLATCATQPTFAYASSYSSGIGSNLVYARNPYTAYLKSISLSPNPVTLGTSVTQASVATVGPVDAVTLSFNPSEFDTTVAPINLTAVASGFSGAIPGSLLNHATTNPIHVTASGYRKGALISTLNTSLTFQPGSGGSWPSSLLHLNAIAPNGSVGTVDGIVCDNSTVIVNSNTNVDRLYIPLPPEIDTVTSLTLTSGQSNSKKPVDVGQALRSRWRTRFSAIWLGKEIVIC